MMKKVNYLMLSLLILSAVSMNAQVTIGDDTDAHPGAVLHLINKTSEQRGLLLPRVALSTEPTEFVLDLTPGNEAAEKEEAAGMLVFNTAKVLNGQGIYVWDGEKWMPLCGGDAILPPAEKGVLINGVRWAETNVDAPGTFAENPEDVGMFYQWNRKIGWSSTDPMINSEGGDTWDNSYPEGTTWETANDPSPAGWRVPTLEEIKSLLDPEKVSSEWTSVNEVNGYKFTDIDSGKSIFLLAASNRGYDGMYIDFGLCGDYWSSTQGGSSSLAYSLTFHNGRAYYDANIRYAGFTIRPVADN